MSLRYDCAECQANARARYLERQQNIKALRRMYVLAHDMCGSMGADTPEARRKLRADYLKIRKALRET